MDVHRSSLPVLRRSEALFRGHDQAELLELGRGAYVQRVQWDELFIDAKLRTRMRAVNTRLSAGGGAFARAAALAQHGLPVFGQDERIDLVVGAECKRHNASDVRRHYEPLPERDVEVIDGIRVTTLERTIYDVIRLCSRAAAVVALDAALHRIAWDDGTNTYDEDAAERYLDGVRRRVWRGRGARGIRQARFVLEFADGRAQSPGESLLRLRMWQANLPTPVLQLRVALPGDRYALLDLACPGLRRWLEFDGLIKITDPDMLGGRTADQVLAAAGARQRQVEAALGWRCDHVEWSDVATLDGFLALQRRIDLFA